MGARCGLLGNARAAIRAPRAILGEGPICGRGAVVENFGSPRAWAFTLLGLQAFRVADPLDVTAVEFQHRLAGRLMTPLAGVETPDWVWFEDSLAYDNARLSQALIATGVSTGRQSYVAAGLRSLRWLMALQTAPSGVFRPVGSQSFGGRRQPPRAFDQQPLEATAMIAGLSGGVARGQQSGVALVRCALRMVRGSQRSVDFPESPGNRELLRWLASRPRQRKPGGESVGFLSARTGADPLLGSIRRGDQRCGNNWAFRDPGAHRVTATAEAP